MTDSGEKRPHILIVDDEFQWAYVMKEIGQLLGVEITITTDPSEGLRLLSFGDYDLLVTDIRMPDESGFDLIRKVRKRIGDIPIVIVTAFDTDKLHRLSRALNVQKVMIKPFRIQDFEAVIAKLLGIKFSI